MGTYLCISISTAINVETSRLTETERKDQDLYHKIVEKCDIDEELYDVEVGDSGYRFILKPSIFESDLTSLLKEFYKEHYFDDELDTKRVIDKLNETPPNEWMDFTRVSRFESFRRSYFGSCDYLRYSVWSHLHVQKEEINISINGKIIMECYDRLFVYLRKCIRDRYSHFKLANALNIYISS